MNIGDEVQLRSRLGSELDLLDPGPLPLDIVVRQGRAVLIRRRALTVAAALVITIAAFTMPKLVHLRSQPAAPPRYHVTVNPPGSRSGSHLIASGRVSYSGNNMRWSVSGAGAGPRFHLRWTEGSWRVYKDGQLIGATGGGSYDDPNPGVPGLPQDPAAVLHSRTGGEPTHVALTVRADVRYLLVSLSNGQVLRLRPVAVLGQAHPALAAIVLPFETAVTEISAYSDRGELGYSVPFASLPGSPPSWLEENPTGDFQIVRWRGPGQPATPVPASYTIGRGTAHGAAWSEQLKVGPWGTCVVTPLGLGNALCYPGFGSGLTGSHLVRSLVSVGRPQDRVSWDAIVAKPAVSYIVALLPHGRLVHVRLYPVDGAKFATIAWTGGGQPTGWIAYAASGAILASGSFP